MSDFGFKISAAGDDVMEASLKELIINSTHPLWKCDLRPFPRHFNQVGGTINIAAGAVKTLHSVGHAYKYVPSFIAAWSYPPGDSTGSTYGLGDLELSSGGDIFYVKMTTDSDQLIIKVDNSSGALPHTFDAQFRFYIFADDFPLYTSIPIAF